MALDPAIRINLERSVVLLVDDNTQALEALSGMVRGFGVRKQFKCKSGAEAMHIVKTQELDLIIIDSAMPDMDGYDFVGWLRREAQPEAVFTPVIMLTGHAARSMVEKSRDSISSWPSPSPPRSCFSGSSGSPRTSARWSRPKAMSAPTAVSRISARRWA
jgi:CheY-like chemotaxis protein